MTTNIRTMKAAVVHFYWSHLAGAKRVLDLGCATGDLGRYRPEDTEVYGLEVNPALVAQAAAYETVQVWDLDEQTLLPFPDDYFDAVVAKDVLEHLQRPWLLLAEVWRVLRPGGVVLASVISYRSRRVWSDYTHVRGFTVHSVRQMFTDAGFRVLDVWRMGGVPLTSRSSLIWLVPYLLRFPVFDWLWTSSFEIKARKPE
jgi:SAM-dependent methyltransferase